MVQPVDYESHCEMQSHERVVTACFNIMCSRAGSFTGSLEGQNAGMLGRFMTSPRPRLKLTCLAHISDSAFRVCVCVSVSVVCTVCVWKGQQICRGTNFNPTLNMYFTLSTRCLERMYSEHKPKCLYTNTPTHKTAKHPGHTCPQSPTRLYMRNVPRKGLHNHGW